MRLGAVIVTYNSSGHVVACLEALLPWKDLIGEGVIVVDNASQDRTAAAILAHPEVRLVANASNVGFAAAVNQAFSLLAEAEAVLLLNPDVVVLSGLDELVATLHSDPKCGIAAGLLRDHSGRPQRGFAVRRFPAAAALCFEVLGINRVWASNPVNKRYRALDLDLAVPQSVEQPAGAFQLVRRDAWLQVGGFDEEFRPVWFEDVDFCQRVHRAGMDIRLVPAATALHHGGHSVPTLTWSERQEYWYGNLLKYASKNLSSTGRRLVALSLLAGSLPRAAMGILSQRSFRPLALFGRVMGFAAMSLISEASRSQSTAMPVSKEDPRLSGS